MSHFAARNLIEFDAFDDVPDYLLETMRYWEAARGDRPIPHMSTIDPTSLPLEALRWIAVFEVLQEQKDFKVRLAGTGIAKLTDREFTGMLVSKIPGSERGMQRMLRCIEEGRPYYSGDPLRWSLGQEFINYSVLCLPFCDDAGVISRLVMVFKFHMDRLYPLTRNT